MNSEAARNQDVFEAAAIDAESQRPLRFSEFIARVVIGASLAALLYALWSSRLDSAVSWTGKELRVLPRMSLFVLTALMALIIQGQRPREIWLLGGGFLALAAAVLLLPLAQVWDVYALPGEQFSTAFKAAAEQTWRPVGVSTRPDAFFAGAAVQVMRFEASILAALLLGTWLGRDIRNHLHFFTLLSLAAVGDIWMSLFAVPESGDSTQLLSLLRMPWPPQIGQLSLSPAFTDLLILTAVIEAGRTLRFHMLSLVLGAVAGYCAGSFLALEPWPAWPMLSMLMMGSGVLVGCWPDLKCTASDTIRALLISSLLMLTLIGFTLLHRKLNPPSPQKVEPGRYYNAI